MANNDKDHGGMEADTETPLLQGQPPAEFYPDSTRDDNHRSYLDGRRHRHHVARRKTNKNSEMTDRDEEHGGMEGDIAAPQMLGQPPESLELVADSTKDGNNRSYRDGLRHRRRVARQKNKITEMTESDEEHGGMEADMKTQLLLGQRADLFADRTHDDDRSNEEGLRQRRPVAGRKTAEITVKFTGMSYPVEVDDLLSRTIGDVKARMQKMSGIPIYAQGIILNGKLLENDCILADCGIKDGSTVHMVRFGGGPPRMATPYSQDDQRPRICWTSPYGICWTPHGLIDFFCSFFETTAVGDSSVVELNAQTGEGTSNVNSAASKVAEFLRSRSVCIQDTWKIFQPNDAEAHIYASKERWRTYSHKALLFSIALFSAYLNNNSTSTSPSNVLRVLFVGVVLLFYIIVAVLALDLWPKCGNALVGISWFFLEAISFLLSISFKKYYGFVFLALAAILAVLSIVFPAGAGTSNGDVDDRGSKDIENGNNDENSDKDEAADGDNENHENSDNLSKKKDSDKDEAADRENKDFDGLFKLSEGIASCGSLITVVFRHYDTLIGPGKEAVGFFFFLIIALGLYLMMVITVRAVSCRHAKWLALTLMLLLLITLSIASYNFIKHPKVLEIQQQNSTPTFGDPAHAQQRS